MITTNFSAPVKRINSIDMLRGFALFGIIMVHCIEFFDLGYTPQVDSPFWQKIDHIVFDSIRFLFQGKSYAIFSLLFGLGFFIQMDSQTRKGNDFRLRFIWRMFILFIFGYLNGLVYMGEFFVVYAILGIILIPLYKISTRWLLILSALLLLQIPDIIHFISLLNNNIPNEPTAAMIYMGQLYDMCADTFINGSIKDVLEYNLWKGQLSKLLWLFNTSRYLQLTGLFIVGMLIGRTNIHKDEEKMIKYSRKIFPYTIVWVLIFSGIVHLLPYLGIEKFALRVGKSLFTLYGNLGMMMFYISGLTLLYYSTNLRKALNKLAPVGRMSVTNYMAQSLMGVFLFYGFGLGLAVKVSFTQSVLLGILMYMFQIFYSNWWIQRYYYGPFEWLWRVLTWLKPCPIRRKNE